MTDKSSNTYIHGRGAQVNTPNPYHKLIRGPRPVSVFEEEKVLATRYIETHPKTILNKVDSPDIGMSWSMNPYQGCEHGCVYCYARNTHPYWGYSAGLDFESVILVKKNAPKLLAEKLASKTWQPVPVMLSGNTDCYQPAEKKFGITRQILEVLWRFRHPVGMITKNSLILRDLDILKKMQKEHLVKVSISINTLDEKLRQKLEPRTTTIAKRLETVRRLSDAGIPVNVMVAPVIPGLNAHEIWSVVKAAGEAGAADAHYVIARLNGDVAAIFEDWLKATYPDRKSKILNKIKSCHGGKLNDSRFGLRMKGEGKIAEIIGQQFKRAKKEFLAQRSMPEYNLKLFERMRNPQLQLFAAEDQGA